MLFPQPPSPSPPLPTEAFLLFTRTVKDIFWLSFSIMAQVMRSVKDAFPSDGKEQQIFNNRTKMGVQRKRATSAIWTAGKIKPFIFTYIYFQLLNIFLPKYAYTFCSWRKQESHTPFSCLNYQKFVKENCSLKKRRKKSKYIIWISINSKSLFSKLIFQKQNHEFTSAHKNSFGRNPCAWESQRSDAMIRRHLRSVDSVSLEFFCWGRNTFS